MLKVVIGVNLIMTVNQLPSIPMYWGCNHFVGNAGIQNNFARTRYQEVLKNDPFAGNTKEDKTDKGYKIKIIDHLNESFQAVFSNEAEKSIDGYTKNFKVCSYFLSQHHHVLQQWHG